MISLAVWNVRGLNRPLKQNEVRQVVKNNKLSLCAILESHVDMDNLRKVCNVVFRRWDWISNGSCCNKGARIILGWDPVEVDVMVLAQSAQVLHVQINCKDNKRIFFCSLVYAANYYVHRQELWQNLRVHKAFIHDKPWVIMGDFNSALNLEDRSIGSSSVSPGMRDFNNCVKDIEVFDIKRTGFQYTWTQKPKKGVGLLKKIDRIMGNVPFVSSFPQSVAEFKPYGVSDLCPCVLKLFSAEKPKPRPFKFANFLVHKQGFLDIVMAKWNINVDGVHQFRVVKKLSLMKSSLRALLYKQGNLHEKVVNARGKLEDIQRAIDKDPVNESLRSQEASVLRVMRRGS
ncbi:uncharacterized protein LOC110900588 [Helianthus annuus]|uniref:uncharacterized protein LOC110900588 n=1 Tax=Helianthus annuus TaxID=4232 RepID=UPI000B9028D8|nr:uncharacterized protein LOC110900588 [Helianthus annuus]